MKPRKLTKAERAQLEAMDRKLERNTSQRAKNPTWAHPDRPTIAKGTGARTGNDFRGEGGVRGAASLVNGFHPKEVRRARALMPSHAHCIKDDGTVRFRNRKEERGFVHAQQVAFARANIGG